MKVFYRPEQVVSGIDSFSPSAGKPLLVLEAWHKLQLDLDVMTFEPLGLWDIALAHSDGYVRGIINGELVNGFGSKDPLVAATLPYTTGSMYAAALYAVTTGETVCSPTSGFHHARYDRAGGFCTFNGLVIAARKLYREGRVARVGIVDLDMHHGDGTEEIIQRLGLEYYIEQYSFGANAGTIQHNAEAWLEKLPDILERQFKDVDLILYQAGADPHVDDPLGGVLTTEQMGRRDLIVFQVFHRLGIPVAWNLAGGYQHPIQKVLELHENTALAHFVVHLN